MSKRTCEFPGCQRDHYAHGLCNPHNLQRRRGQTLRPLRVYENTVEGRFWAKVRYEPEALRCWEWTGARRPEGHGVFRVNYGANKNIPAHMYSYELLIGLVPEKLVLDHLCRNPGCVNPFHLDPVPQGVNVIRGDAPPGVNIRKTHCVRGHEFTEDNIYRTKEHPLHRQCRECSLARSRAQQA